MVVMNKLVKESIEICLTELNKDETKNKILNPVIDCILEKIQPYVLGLSIFFVVLILLILCILYLIIFMPHNASK